MYLEISPRQSGKTTRLFNKVIETCEEGKYQPVIVCGSRRMVQYFKEMLQKYDFEHGTFCQHQVKVISTQMRNEIESFQRGSFEPGRGGVYVQGYFCKFFYDEFDFFPKTFNMFDPSGYYCTTPSKIRKKRDPQNKTDLLLKLVRYKRGKFQSYPSTKWLCEDFPDNERFGTFFDGYYTKPWTLEPEQDMEIYHGEGVLEELIEALCNVPAGELTKYLRNGKKDKNAEYFKKKCCEALELPPEYLKYEKGTKS